MSTNIILEEIREEMGEKLLHLIYRMDRSSVYYMQDKNRPYVAGNIVTAVYDVEDEELTIRSGLLSLSLLLEQFSPFKIINNKEALEIIENDTPDEDYEQMQKLINEDTFDIEVLVDKENREVFYDMRIYDPFNQLNNGYRDAKGWSAWLYESHEAKVYCQIDEAKPQI